MPNLTILIRVIALLILIIKSRLNDRNLKSYKGVKISKGS